jgi:pyruvate kinase
MPRRTKIVATIGPASASQEQLVELARAGMDGARLNLSHGTHDEHRDRARLIRATEAEVGRPIALIADLQGPKLRIGELDGPVTLARGEDVVVAGGESSTDGELPVSPAVISEVLQPGHEVLIDDGLVRLRVETIESGRARCAVLSGGVVSSHKGVNLPGVPIPIPSLTRKDMDDLDLAIELGVDFIALSFVRSAADVRDLRALIEQTGSHAHVIAKIEKAEAVDALDAILAETDAVMVARGDLGVEIGVALVPLLQKRIIIAALERGKPVITATQMLESMVNSRLPTRAEATDVANAILDGTDCVMLSGESAMGKFPEEAVTMLARIAAFTEAHRPRTTLGAHREFLLQQASDSGGDRMTSVVENALDIVPCDLVLVPTRSGTTARMISRFKPHVWMIAPSVDPAVCQGLAFSYGVHPVDLGEEDVDWREFAERWLKREGLTAKRLLLVAGPSKHNPKANHRIELMRLEAQESSA